MVGPEVKQISENVWQIGTFEFTQYLVGNPPTLLIEGGISPQSLLLLSQLKDKGLTPGDLNHLCILHGHFDHLGTFPLIMQKAPHVKVVSGEKNRDILSRPRILERMLESSKAITAYAKKIKFLPEIYELTSLSPLPIHIPLKDGDSFSSGSITLQFTALPGHSPDAMGAYLASDGVFFASDMAGLYFPDGTIRPNYYFSLQDYESSLEKITTFDIETLCFGHNGCLSGFKNVKAFLERTIDFTDKLKRQIKDWFDSGRDLEKLAQQFAHGATKGFLAFFPFEHNLMLSRLLIRRTLEYYGIPTD
ncbi:MAG: hypothetical protein DSY91_05770 [Deltaproteobacteria bacterium]|nr:MAG: hypothetical protein DSY91_05770 [Deltaproteobacteria bacterium]